MSTDTVDDVVSSLTNELDSLIEKVNEEEELVSREDYNVRELQNGDYAISTPGKTYLIRADGSISEHKKGKTAEAYDGYDESIESEIEEILEENYQ
ncbi:MAG: hypothetical protein ACI9LV_000823 [Candidatus Nanohaloarchaea archaeon]|jgi:hypothetical protein